MTMVGTYTLHLYCDNYDAEGTFGDYKLLPGGYGRVDSNGHVWNEFPHTYIHELGSKCRTSARRDGWFLGKDKQFCPKCSGK
jgi:hypothetical protein